MGETLMFNIFTGQCNGIEVKIKSILLTHSATDATNEWKVKGFHPIIPVFSSGNYVTSGQNKPFVQQ